MTKSDDQLELLQEALYFAQQAAAGAAAELEGELTEHNNADARCRLLAAERTVEEIEARIALRRMKLSGRKVH